MFLIGMLQCYYMGRVWYLINQPQRVDIHCKLHDALGECRNGEISLRLIRVLRTAIHYTFNTPTEV